MCWQWSQRCTQGESHTRGSLPGKAVASAQLIRTIRTATICAACALFVTESGRVLAQSEVVAQNQKKAMTASQCPETPPAYKQLSYEESYAYLRNRNCQADLWDPIKYLDLSSSGEDYLSLGGYIRERYEYFHND